MRTVKQIHEELKRQQTDFSFCKPFNAIIKNQLKNYNNKELFFTDMQKGGCITGMIGQFIYHNDCMKFYTKHIHDLEEFKTELEDNIGPIDNSRNLPHYTFIVWLTFEEYCMNLYNTLYEN